MRTFIKIILIVAAIAALAIGGYYLYERFYKGDEGMVEAIDVEDNTEPTHGLVMFEEIELDTLMLGRWQHTVDTGWYRVYTTEPAGEDYYWGREWNTTEDIFEEDLQPYGNGWFKWKKEGNELLEVHMTDNRGAAVPREYQMLKLNGKVMNCRETLDREKHSFRKIGD